MWCRNGPVLGDRVGRRLASAAVRHFRLQRHCCRGMTRSRIWRTRDRGGGRTLVPMIQAGRDGLWGERSASWGGCGREREGFWMRIRCERPPARRPDRQAARRRTGRGCGPAQRVADPARLFVAQGGWQAGTAPAPGAPRRRGAVLPAGHAAAAEAAGTAPRLPRRYAPPRLHHHHRES